MQEDEIIVSMVESICPYASIPPTNIIINPSNQYSFILYTMLGGSILAYAYDQ